MSGQSFDDLLPQTGGTVTLDNPFEDPFSGFGGNQRTSDPWAQSHTQSNDVWGHGQDDWGAAASATTQSWDQPQETHVEPDYTAPRSPVTPKAEIPEPIADAPVNGSHKPPSAIHIRQDPLDVASVLPPSPPPASPKKPPVQPPAPPAAVPETPLTPAPAPAKEPEPEPLKARSPSPELSKVASQASIASEAPSKSSRAPSDAMTTKYERIVSPLETPVMGATGHERTYSHLALGGEVAGWNNGTQSAAEWGGAAAVQPPPPQPQQQTGWTTQTGSGWATNTQKQTGWMSDTGGDIPEQAEPESAEDPSARSQSPVLGAAESPTDPPEPKGPRPMFTITVGDPQKVGDPISAHILYTVQTRTTSTAFAKSEFSVLRRYSDFLWLFDMLCANNPGVVIPPVPEKHSFGRFQDAFVESRQLALNKCIQKIANHPRLCNDPDLKIFLESDTFALDMKHRRPENEGGLIGLLSNSISGSRFFETDEWFDRKKAYLDSLEAQLRGLVKAIDFVTKQRVELIQATNEFAEAIEALSGSELSRQLSTSLSVLADVERKHKENLEYQSKEDVITIMGTVEEYTRLINSVRLAFSSRVRCYTTWQNADNELRRVKTNHERNKKQGRIPPERMGYALSELADHERRASEAKREFDSVSKLLKVEIHRFEMERVDDFKASLEAFLDSMIARQKELIKAWEGYQEGLLRKAGANPKSQSEPESSEVEATLLSPTPS